tara:strand:- start:191 stop:388 length:198 start_codon:yes stop_codon:yes gene_type:complete
MNKDSKLHRIRILKDQHKHQHNLVEALEAERAPEEAIAKAKRKKLSLKDEIVSIETQLQDEGITQ